MPRRVEQTKAWRELQEATNLREIVVAVERNYHEMLLASHWHSQADAICRSRLRHFLIHDVYIDKGGNTSNSHHAPRGKKTNWGGWDEDLPRGYLGFSANCKWEIEGMTYDRGLADFDLGRALNRFGIHTMTGQTGDKGRIHVQVFFEDFEGLNKKVQEYQEVMRREEFLAKLAGKPYNKSLSSMII